MTRSIHVGCAALPARMTRAGYFAALDYVECALWQPGPVKSATWRKWTDESPADGLGLLAPSVVTHPELRGARWPVDPAERYQIGHLRPSAAATAALTAFADAALGPHAGAIVFPTPPSFSPSAAHRDLLRAFFAELAPAERFAGAARIWQPSGLWDAPTAAKAATEAGITLAWDPLGDPMTPPETFEALEVESVYWRVAGLGRSGPLSPDHLDRLAALAEVHPSCWVVLATPDAWKDSRRLRAIVQK